MCGIFGYFSTNPLNAERLASLVTLGKSQQERGHHAFGLAYSDKDGNATAHKQAGPISLYEHIVRRSISSVAVIGHTRWATHGSADDNANNHPHPFLYRGQRCYLVHNGIIGNYLDIARRRGLELYSDCDSEVVARHIENGKGHIMNRLVEAVKDIDRNAPFAAAILTPDAIIIARRGNPMFWSKDGESQWFASTKSKLSGEIFNVPNNRAYMIPRQEGSVMTRKLARREKTNLSFIGSDTFTEDE